jgi:hypothetical protein
MMSGDDQNPVYARSAGRPRWALVAAAVAVVFGLASIVSGGRVLFGAPEARAAAGEIVLFVLWFNFLTGFAYVAAGIGLMQWRRWGGQLSLLLAVSILIAAAFFARHIILGGAYEMRTVLAMLLRSAFWVTLAVIACWKLNCFSRQSMG